MWACVLQQPRFFVAFEPTTPGLLRSERHHALTKFQEGIFFLVEPLADAPVEDVPEHFEVAVDADFAVALSRSFGAQRNVLRGLGVTRR
jgi:hypothetical protein